MRSVTAELTTCQAKVLRYTREDLMSFSDYTSNIYILIAFKLQLQIMYKD